MAYKNKKEKKQFVDLSAIERSMPHNDEAERGLLGALMIDPNVFDEVSDLVKTSDFYVDAHRRIYGGIIRIFAKHHNFDLYLLIDHLKHNEEIEAVGGHAYLAELMANTHVTGHAMHYAKLIQDSAAVRRFMTVGANLIQNGHDPSVTGDQMRAVVDESLRLEDTLQSDGENSATSWVHKVMDAVSSPEKSAVVPSGIHALDELLNGGFRAGNFPLIAARPAMGKSAFMKDVALNIAEAGIPVGVISLEMLAAEFGSRAFASRSDIPLSTIMRPNRMEKYHFDAFIQAADHLATLPLQVYDKPITLSGIHSLIRKWIRKHGIKMVFIDYIGLVRHDNPRLTMFERITDISQSLKQSAQSLKIPICALAQLNREATRGKGATVLNQAKLAQLRPRLEHLRDTGSLEQDCDIAIFVHRPELLVTKEEADDLDLFGKAEIIVAKQRQGRTGLFEMEYDGKHTQFLQLESRDVLEYTEFNPSEQSSNDPNYTQAPDEF